MIQIPISYIYCFALKSQRNCNPTLLAVFFSLFPLFLKNILVLLKVFTIWLEIPKVSLPNTTIADPCSTKKEARQCRLNGKAVLKLNEDLGAKMRPLDSRTVFIDVKVRPLNVY